MVTKKDYDEQQMLLLPRKLAASIAGLRGRCGWPSLGWQVTCYLVDVDAEQKIEKPLRSGLNSEKIQK